MLHLLLAAALSGTFVCVATAESFAGTGYIEVVDFGTTINVGCLASSGKWTTQTCGLFTGSQDVNGAYKLTTSAGDCLLIGNPAATFKCTTGKGYENFHRNYYNQSILTYGHVDDGHFYGLPPGNGASALTIVASGGLTEVQLVWEAAS